MQTNDQGDVILNIGANINKARTAINDLTKNVSNVFKAFRGQAISSPKLDKLNAQAEQSAAKIKSLQDEIESMQNSFSDKPTVAMQRLIDKENELEAAARKAKEQITGTTPKPLADKYNQQYENIRQKISEVSAEQLKLQESGKAFVTVAEQQPQTFAKVNDQLKQEQSNFAGIQSQINNISDAGQSASNRVSKTFKNMGNSVVNAFRKIRTHAKSSANSASDSFGNINKAVKKGITSIVKYGLGIRSLFVLFRKLRSAVVDTYKDLAAYSNEVNLSVSGAKSALSTLKNSVSAAIQPLISTFAPVVTSVANRLTSMVGNVGEFFAALTGQEYVYKAVGVQESYADALDSTADNAKKAAKALDAYLSPLDDINRYTANETSDSDSDAAASTAKFTKTKVDNSFKNLADRVKGYFTEIFQPIKLAWSKYGKPVMTEWKTLTNNVKGIILDIGRDFKNVWKNGTGEKTAGNILKLWKSVLGVINSVVGTLRNAWKKDALGEKVIQSFANRFNNLLLLIQTVADSFKDVWNSGSGERIWSNILSIVKNVNNIIGGFWKILTDAWNANDNGKRIWGKILGSIEDVFGWLEELSGIKFDWVEDLNLSPMMSAASGLVGAFRDLAKVLMSKFKTAYRDVLLPLAKWTIEEAVPKLIEWFGSAIKIVANILDVFPVNVLVGIAAGIGAVFAAMKAYKAAKFAWEYIKGLGVAFEGLWTAITAHPYATAILAVVAALTATVAAIEVANATKWNTSDLKKSTDKINEYFDDVAEAAQNMKDAIENVNKSHIEIQADVSQAETLKDRLMEVIKDGIIDEDEMPEYETIINLLNKVDGFEEMWNNMDLQTIDGKIYINADEATTQLNEFIDKWKQTQWATALSSDYSNIYSTLGTNQRDIAQMQSKEKVALNNLKDYILRNADQRFLAGLGAKYGLKSTSELRAATEDEWRQILDDLQSMSDVNIGGNYDEVASAYFNAKNTLSDYTTEQSRLKTALEDNWEAQKFLNGETSNYVGALYAVDSGLISEADALELLKDTGVTSYGELKNLAEVQRDVQLGNNEAISESNAKLSDDTQTHDLEILESGQKAYGGVHDSGVEAHHAINLSSDETAKASKKNSNTVERNYIDAFSSIKKHAAILWDTLKGIFNDDGSMGKGIVNFAISGINKVIQGINVAIKTICELINNGFSGLRDFEFAGIKPFTWLPYLNAPQIGEIPALARGAVLPAGKPFVAMLGDQKNGRNLEAPEELIRQIVREETENRSKNNTYTIPVQIGRKTLFTLVLDEARLQQNQIGYNPLVKLGG